MKILVSGSTGLVGRALEPSLIESGYSIVRLVRPSSKVPAAEATVSWNPDEGTVDAAGLEASGPYEGVVHLAGEGIADGRWTEEKKRRIRDSRVRGTTALCEALAKLSAPPRVYVGASAIGYYGNRGAEILRETSGAGTGFLPEICVAWEQATAALVKGPTRVVLLRIGVILSRHGGALGKMLLPFRLGLGGRIGRGDQYMSWIAIDDVVGLIIHALEHDTVRGSINAVAPNPATNAEFTRTLGRALGRPTIFPMPGFAARLAFGEMADELLLGSTRVEPAAAIDSGFRFRYPMLDAALKHVLAG
jgi:uncharacterized protein (TIGR01777 family)